MEIHRRSVLYATIAALGLLASLAGCGSASKIDLDKVKIEREIAKSILLEHNVYTRVSCPTEIQQIGRTFKCEAKLTVGTYPVQVTETNGAGHVHYVNEAPFVVLDSAKVATSIEGRLLRERHLQARVSCPSDVLQEKGLVFTCTARAGTRSYPFEVTQMNSQGHVSFIGR